MTERGQINGAVSRIESSIFATPEECEEARRLGEGLKSAAGVASVELRSELRRLLKTVLDRESGQTTLTPEEREAISESLDDLQNRLIEEIKARKVSQRRDMTLILLLLIVLVGLTSAAALLLLFSKGISTQDAVAKLTATAFLLSVSILAARLFQNSREALERLDEKIVAVRFLRMSLHPHWTIETSAELMASAVGMFVHHFAPTSTTLSAEDTSRLFPAIPGLPRKGKDSS
jgi:HPt (histidine-containing phosphotransfer) domain-containing protein